MDQANFRPSGALRPGTFAFGFALGVVLLGAVAVESRAGTVTLREKLDLLKQHYPAAIAGVGENQIILRDGSKLTIDDGQKKTHQEKLKTADIEDSLAQVYPIAGCHRGEPQRNSDPGRIRNDALLRHLYGQTKSAARADMVKIDWFGSQLLVTKRHGAGAALKGVRDDLAKLPATFQKYFKTSAGTFNWRVIAGTSRLSVHSFGAAIDLDVKFADYWRWVGGKPGRVPKYVNKIPKQIVEIFERHGFIWGGKWYHFDTMHFEFRPELVAIGRLAAQRGCA